MSVSTTTVTGDDDRQAALAWLRGALTATLEVCPLSYQQKKGNPILGQNARLANGKLDGVFQY